MTFKDEPLTSEQFDTILPPSGRDGEEQDRGISLDGQNYSYHSQSGDDDLLVMVIYSL